MLEAQQTMKTESQKLRILIDSREQCPLDFGTWPTIRRGLPCGDYGVEHFSDWQNPQFIVERKSLDDLTQSLGRGRRRFMAECMKLRQFRFAALVIESTIDQVALGQYRSTIAPASVLSSLDCLAVRCGIHIFWSGDPAGAADRVASLARMFLRGIEKDAAKLKAKG